MIDRPSDPLHAPKMLGAPVQTHRQIPSLDGLRALSVTLVILLHTLQRFGLTHHVPLLAYVLANGAIGVQIFFVISGFLITTLLLREREKTGRISLGSFYVRRAFRILPPLYFYLLVIVLLGWTGRLPDVTGRKMLVAFTLTSNYLHWPAGWYTEHFWSLCIEEQFYLLWPGLLVFCLLRWRGTRRKEVAACLALAFALLEPPMRLFYFRHLPAPHYYSMFHLASDGLMFGAIGALLQGTQRFEAVYRRLTRWPWLLPMVIFFVLGTLNMKYENYFRFPLGFTLESIAILMWLLWLVRNPDSLQGRVLNRPAIRWVGRLSYSIYLWQTCSFITRTRRSSALIASSARSRETGLRSSRRHHFRITWWSSLRCAFATG